MAVVKGQVVKAHCNKCVGERNHEVLHGENIERSDLIDERYEVEWCDGYDMLRCCGCETITLRHTYWFSEDMNPDGGPIVYTTYYPPAVSRREPEWLLQLGDVFADDEQSYIYDLLKEIYSALHNDSRRLAAMGIRALLESAMIYKVGDQGSFVGNLKMFESAGFVSGRQRELLETIFEAGHATIHRAFSPTKEDLVTLIDIAESVLEGVYAHSDQVKKLKGRIPPR